MATRAIAPDRPAPNRRAASTRGSPSTPPANDTERASRSPRLSACRCPRSADLAGRPIALSPDVPALFDDPLAEHHKLIGRWAASRIDAKRTFTRVAARERIERIFADAVAEVLAAIDCVELRTVVLRGADGAPPAILLVCDTVGQLDLGWIETGDAPVAWRAAAYHALERMLGTALPVFGYQDLFEQISCYYWDGEIDDAAARQALIDYHGADPEEADDLALPSEMDARRPDWMIAANAAPLRQLPRDLRLALIEFRRAHRALVRTPEANAWFFDAETLYEYVPGIEECSSLPPLTLVPVEQFECEVDDVGRHGMELGFMDAVGLCPLLDASIVDDWFATLRLGARFLTAAQALIRLSPAIS